MNYNLMSTEELLILQQQLKSNVSKYSNLQQAFKILINSFYGATGTTAFRYYDLRVAEGITTSGQLSIRWIANKINELMNKVMQTESKDYIILVDTDSVVISLETLVEKHCKDKNTQYKLDFMDNFDKTILQPYVEKKYLELSKYVNAYTQSMHAKRENLVDVMLSVSKKRYVMSVHNSEGIQYSQPKLKVMGLQMVKSSTPGVIRDKLKQALEIILRGTESDIQQYVSRVRKEFNTLSVEDISFPRGINNISKFQGETSTIYKKACPIHVRGALLYNFYIKQKKLDKMYELLLDGDKGKFVYLKTPNPIQENIITFPGTLPTELGLHQYVDYNKMFIKTFLDVVDNVLVPLNWTSEEIVTLEGFFS